MNPALIAPPYPLSQSQRDELARRFTYHKPTPHQAQRYVAIRTLAGDFAQAVASLCPPGPQREQAIDLIHWASMAANAAIACGEPDSDEVANAITMLHTATAFDDRPSARDEVLAEVPDEVGGTT